MGTRDLRGILLGFLLAVAAITTHARSESPTLSFNVERTFDREVAGIRARDGFGKTGWSAVSSYTGCLIGERCSAQDRVLLAKRLIRGELNSDRVDHDGLFEWIAVPLVESLARDGERDLVRRILAERCPDTLDPLLTWLHGIHMDGTLPNAVELLVEAYHIATPAGRQRLIEALDFNLPESDGYSRAGTNDAKIAWLLNWYERHKPELIADADVGCCSQYLPQEQISLITIREWLKRDLRHCYLRSAFPGDHAANASATASFLRERNAWDESKRDFKGDARAELVSPANGRSESFRLDDTHCDVKIVWKCGDRERSAILPYVFSPEAVYYMSVVGEQWERHELPNDDANLPKIVVCALAGQHSVAARVAKLLPQLKPTDVLPDNEPLSIKVYPTPDQLQASVALTCDESATAWSIPGASLKIAATETDSDDTITARLNAALVAHRTAPDQGNQPRR